MVPSDALEDCDEEEGTEENNLIPPRSLCRHSSVNNLLIQQQNVPLQWSSNKVPNHGAGYAIRNNISLLQYHYDRNGQPSSGRGSNDTGEETENSMAFLQVIRKDGRNVSLPSSEELPTSSRYVNNNMINSNNTSSIDNNNPTSVVEVEGFLPIKKRRLKENLGNREEVKEVENLVIDYSSSSATGTSATGASQSTAINSDNSRTWWYQANQEWSKNARVNPNNYNNNRAESTGSIPRRRNNNTSSSFNPSAELLPENDLNPSQQEEQPLAASSSTLTVLDKPKYHNKDPRSDEYQKWLTTFYFNRFASPSPNALMNKLRLANPEQEGGIYPPWVTPEALQKWAVSVSVSGVPAQTASDASSPPTCTLKISQVVEDKSHHQQRQGLGQHQHLRESSRARGYSSFVPSQGAVRYDPSSYLDRVF